MVGGAQLDRLRRQARLHADVRHCFTANVGLDKWQPSRANVGAAMSLSISM